MAKKSSQKKKVTNAEMDAEFRKAMNTPWIAMRTGLIIMAFASLGITIFIAWQLAPSEGFWRAVGWGLVFGVAMWLIFAGGLWFNRFIRRGQS